jgi:rfaE bifunctional protein nucleotidyltransferase chain/domain
MRATSAPVFYSIGEIRNHLASIEAGRVVLANGCFDLLHVGHVRYLRGAADLGDFLVVAVNDDGSTRRIKGPGRPIMNHDDRAALLSALGMVDAVLIFDTDTVAPVLEALRPWCHAKGTDYTVDTVPEIETSRRLGIRCEIVGDPKRHSTRELAEGIGRRRRSREDGS